MVSCRAPSAWATRAGQEHAVRHVAALVQVDALLQRAVEADDCRLLVDLLRRAFGQGGDTVALQHPPVGAHQRLAGQHAADALEDGFGAGGELDLQQFVAGGLTQRPWHDAGLQQRPRLRGEGQAGGGLGGVERLDAERIARQRYRAGGAVVDGDAVHATQVVGEAGALAQPQVQRRLVVAVGGEAHAGHVAAQLAVVIDLAIAHQRRRAGEQRLVAAG